MTAASSYYFFIAGSEAEAVAASQTHDTSSNLYKEDQKSLGSKVEYSLKDKKDEKEEKVSEKAEKILEPDSCSETDNTKKELIGEGEEVEEEGVKETEEVKKLNNKTSE